MFYSERGTVFLLTVMSDSVLDVLAPPRELVVENVRGYHRTASASRLSFSNASGASCPSLDGF
jgi:hypothetical protein